VPSSIEKGFKVHNIKYLDAKNVVKRRNEFYELIELEKEEIVHDSQGGF
jgi:hypothetical protein